MNLSDVRQLSVADWKRMLENNQHAREQIEIIRQRQERGEPLATWEKNCIKAADNISHLLK